MSAGPLGLTRGRANRRGALLSLALRSSRYRSLNATIGSTRVARRAGT